VKKQMQRLKLLVGLTGSVASIKAPQLIAQLQEFAEVRIVATKAAQHFAKDLSAPVLVDADEWSTWTAMGDDVLHIEVRSRPSPRV
jgi:phosphopantothenoylcysteine decarboxylase